MAKGYWIGRVDVTNEPLYRRYMEANGPVFAQFGGRFLVRGGKHSIGEGEARARNVVIEFPNYDAARACWDSPEYQAVKALRDGHGIADIIVVEGYDGPQPA